MDIRLIADISQIIKYANPRDKITLKVKANRLIELFPAMSSPKSMTKAVINI